LPCANALPETKHDTPQGVDRWLLPAQE